LEKIADVLNVSLAGLRTGINIELDFNEMLKTNIDNLKNIKLVLPRYFDVSIESEGSNKDYVHFNKDLNMLTLDNLDVKGVKLRIRFNGLRFTDGAPDEFGYSAYFTPDSASFVGGVIIDADYVNETAAVRGAPAKMQDAPIIHCKSSMDEKVVLTEAKGHFNPKIDLGEDIGSFNIDNLPDFLDDDDVHLNLDNPELRIWVNSNMDIRGFVESARIKAYDASGKEVYVEIDTQNSPLFIDPHTGEETGVNGDSLTSTKTAIVITDKPYTGVKAPHTYYGTVKQGTKLSDLFYNIPRKVQFDFSVAADPEYEGYIKLGYKNAETQEPWYTIQPSYEFYSPLALDAGSIIVYRDSLTGWHKDLEDIRLSDGASITLTADVYNNVPLDLKLHAKAIELDESGTGWKDLDENLISVAVTDNTGNDVRIKAGTAENQVMTPIKIEISQKSKEGFARIDGIAYSATAIASDEDSMQGIALSQAKHRLRIDNIGVILHGKIIFDFND
jgi:hypothetical protein